MHDTDTLSSVSSEVDDCDPGRPSNCDRKYNWHVTSDSDEASGNAIRKRYVTSDLKGENFFDLLAVEPERDKQPKKLTTDLTISYGIPDELPLLDLASMNNHVDLQALSSLVTRIFNLPPPPYLPQLPEPDLAKIDFLMSMPMPGRNTYAADLPYISDTSAYGHAEPIMTYGSPRESGVCYTCWSAPSKHVENVKFDLEVVIKMVTDSEYLDHMFSQNYFSEMTSLNQADLKKYLNSVVLRSFVQDLVIWCQCLKDMTDKYSIFSRKVLEAITVRKGFSDACMETKLFEKYDNSLLVVVFEYQNRIAEARKEVDKLRWILWLLLQSSSNCLSQWNPPSSTRELYESILTYLGVPNQLHDSVNGSYTQGSLLKYVVRIVFFPVLDVADMLEGAGEGMSEEEAAEEAFRELLRALCSRFVDFMETNESSTLSHIVNMNLFSRIQRDQPQVIRSDSFIDLRNAVKATSKNLAENPYHVRIGAMHQHFEDLVFFTTPSPMGLKVLNDVVEVEVEEPMTTPEMGISVANSWDAMPLLQASLNFLNSPKNKLNSCKALNRTKANSKVKEISAVNAVTEMPLIPANVDTLVKPLNITNATTSYPRVTESPVPAQAQEIKIDHNQIFRGRNGPSHGFNHRTYYYDRNYNYIPVPVCGIPVMTSSMYRPRRHFNTGFEIAPRFRTTPQSGAGHLIHNSMHCRHQYCHRPRIPIEGLMPGSNYGTHYIRNSNTYNNAPVQYSFPFRQRNGYRPSCRLCVTGMGMHTCSRY